jgi:biopolymer transport protein ExbD
MGMSNSAYKADEATPNINVTPMIDILLVLLIIFMAISPLKPARFEAKVPAEPKPDDATNPPRPNPLTLVVQLDNNLRIKLNTEDMGDVTDTSALSARLTTIFKEREQSGVFREGTNEVEKTLFVKAPRAVRYNDVVKVIDAVKVTGAQPIGLQIDDLQ